MHLCLLNKSTATIDRGETDESIRMAVSMRDLLHDPRNTISLFTHLKAKDIFLTSTCQPIPDNAIVSSGTMVFSQVTVTPDGPRAEMKAALGDGPPINYHLKAEDWVNQTIFIIARGQHRRISSKD